MEYTKNNILEKLEKNSDDKYILPLVNPIKFGPDTIDQFELVEPKAKHIRKMPAEPIVDDILKICADLAGQPDSAIDELSLKDVDNLSTFFEAFN